MSKKKKKRVRDDSVNFHHFCFQRKHWQQGYAHLLRNHWYCGAYISVVLHRDLHSKIHDTPTPNGADCKRAYEELCRREREGLILAEDPPWVRLDFLIEMFEDRCPATTAILAWQRQIITKYYKKAP